MPVGPIKRKAPDVVGPAPTQEEMDEMDAKRARFSDDESEPVDPEQQSLWVQMEVPHGTIGGIVGAGGSNINFVSEVSGCDVQVGKPRDNVEDRDVDFHGTPIQVYIAQIMILRKVLALCKSQNQKNGAAWARDRLERRTMEVDVPLDLQKKLIFPNDPIARMVESQAGVRMQLPFNPQGFDETDDGMARIDIVGNMLEGHMASVIIENLVEGRSLPELILKQDYEGAKKVRDTLEGWGAQDTVRAMERMKQPPMGPNSYYMDPKTGRFGVPTTPAPASPPQRRSDSDRNNAMPEGAFRGMEMLFPAQHVGLGLVGKGGSLITSISKKSGCDVQVIRDSRANIMDTRLPIHETALKTVEFCGTADQQIEACQEVGECCMQVCGEVILCVPKMCCPMLVGKAGAGIKRLELDNALRGNVPSIQVRDTSHGMGAIMIKGG